MTLFLQFKSFTWEKPNSNQKIVVQLTNASDFECDPYSEQFCLVLRWNLKNFSHISIQSPKFLFCIQMIIWIVHIKFRFWMDHFFGIQIPNFLPCRGNFGNNGVYLAAEWTLEMCFALARTDGGLSMTPFPSTRGPLPPPPTKHHYPYPSLQTHSYTQSALLRLNHLFKEILTSFLLVTLPPLGHNSHLIWPSTNLF